MTIALISRRIAPLPAVILALAAGVALAAGPEPGPGPYDLTIFHTNDTHSHLFPRPATWRDDGRMVGGIVPLAWHLADQRRHAAPDLLLDAGDFMTGNPVCNLREDGVPGVAVARMMTQVGYDAGVVGNHEFDVGRGLLERLIPHFGYPVLAADLRREDGGDLFRTEPVVFERGDLRVGVMGLSCGEMYEVVTAARLEGLVLADQVAVIRDQIRELDPVTDLLVLLSHNGVDRDRELAAALAGDGLDVIVGGHSHTRLKEPLLVDGVLIVQAGSAMTSLGRLDLVVADDRVVRYDGRLITLWSDGTHGDDDLNALVAGYENRVREEFGQRLGDLQADLKKSRGEHDLGNWLSDVLRTRAGADAAVINSGGIRRSLSRGPLTALDIHELLPFANTLVTARLTGEQMAALVQKNADNAVSGGHGILQVSGLTYAYSADADGKTARVEEITVGGAPLIADRTYTVAMPDFVAMMSHVYLNVTVPPVTDLGETLSEVVVAAVKEAGTIAPPPRGRIRVLDRP